MIEFTNVSLIRSGKILFSDFSWKINPGEHWVITGRNGSGKTLLLEMLSGHTHIPKGTLTYDFVTGITWDLRHAQKKAAIGFVPANAIHALIPRNSELYYQQRYYDGADSGTMKVRALLGADDAILNALNLPENLSISHLLPLEITRLSNGQLRKVLLTKNLLAGAPKLLLLDYPFDGLDIASRKEMCDFIDHIATHHKTTIIITDHGHVLPATINRRLLLEDFSGKDAPVPDLQRDTPRILHSLETATWQPSPETDSNARPAVISLSNVTIRYGGKTIIDRLNWTVRQGERWALTGRNGAGKTTLFSMIFADHPFAYTQDISLFGRRRGTGESIWDIKRRIAYLGPELVSYSQHDSAVNGWAYAESLRPAASMSRIADLVDYFEAGSWFERPVGSFSSGQLQLLQIIICFASEKEMLLLDEPFQFLDPQHKDLLRHWLQAHLDKEKTMILITHYDEDVREWTAHRMRL